MILAFYGELSIASAVMPSKRSTSRERLLYVECKTGGHAGEAWIGLVTFSKAGTTIYFNGLAYRSLKGRGFSANYADVETGEEYWITGVKKRGTNRHRFGSGLIHVDRRAVSPLLKHLGEDKLDPRRFVVGDAAETEPRLAELHEKEHRTLARNRRDESLPP
jgi:hypothetical protein